MRPIHVFATVVGLLVLAPSAAQALCVARPSMSGLWRGDDGGSYFVRQSKSGKRVWWFGQSGDGGKTFMNVFKGTRDGDSVSGEWADVRGGGSGTLQLRIVGQSGAPGRVARFDKVGETGTGFGGRRWDFPCDDN